MKKALLLMTACTLAACSSRVPTDTQLATLLRRENAPATDPKAPLDASAVQCLRTWSGDKALTKDLPAGVLSDVAKGRCRSTVDGWIADSKRNPDKLDFASVSTPAAVQRALALLSERSPVAVPPAMTQAPATTAPTAQPAAMRPHVEPGPAPEIEATLAQAKDLCQQVKDFVMTDKSDVRLNRYAEYCTTTQPTITRGNVDRMKASGDSAGVDRIARSTAHSNATVEAMLRSHQPAQKQ